LRSLFTTLRITILAAAIGSATAATADQTRYAWPVIGIKDGDTLTVRLRSVDTPESGGRAKCASERKLAERATLFTRTAITAARRIEFEQPSWDKYGGRIDADVWVDGKLLADQLIAAGLARQYDGGKRRGWC
jgi:endonuclease YncB( thermonuclease family)